jgi:hypothetical protein
VINEEKMELCRRCNGFTTIRDRELASHNSWQIEKNWSDVEGKLGNNPQLAKDVVRRQRATSLIATSMPQFPPDED